MSEVLPLAATVMDMEARLAELERRVDLAQQALEGMVELHRITAARMALKGL